MMLIDLAVGDVIAKPPPYNWKWVVEQKVDRGVVVVLHKCHGPQNPHRHLIEHSQLRKYRKIQ